MHDAKRNKNDEFYTQLTDIEKEMRHYRQHFEGKTIYLNCDDPRWSNFFIHFATQFAFYKLNKLIATHYNPEGVAYKFELTNALNPTVDGILETDIAPYLTKLKGDGDFRSEEAIEMLKEADIVITNPPFSLFREYIAHLIEYDKQFLVIGNMNALANKEIFPLIKDNKLWLGINSVKEFLRPDGEIQKFGNILWFTNLQHTKRNEKLVLFRKYMPEIYPKYDNYDAINVNKVVDIPMDYDGEMGVPITFIDKFNPKQFEILGLVAGNTRVNGGPEFLKLLNYKQHPEDRGGCGINGKRVYSKES